MEPLRIWEEIWTYRRQRSIKAVLRKEMKERLKGLSEGRKRELDEALCRRLLSLPEFSAPRTVYAYASLSWEPDTWEILRALLSRGFRLALPRVEGREMRFILSRILRSFPKAP